MNYTILYVCPHPDCKHMGEAITNVHCMNVHGMTKKQLFAKYGNPIWHETDNKLMKKNMAVGKSREYATLAIKSYAQNSERRKYY